MERETLLKILEAGRMAPSAHNSQPWQFLIRNDTIIVRPNAERAISVGDPNHRELFLSIGCAIENILVSARHFGFTCSTRIAPDGLATSIEINFVTKKGDDATEKHFNAITTRFSSREPYDKTALDQETIDYVMRLQDEHTKVHVITDMPTKQSITDIVLQAEVDALEDKAFRYELAQWLRPANKKAETGIVVPAIIPFIIRHINVAKLERPKTKRILMHATPAFVIISTRLDDISSWIHAGQCFERIALYAASKDLTTGPLSAIIQTGAYYQALQQSLKISERPQMFFRIGHRSPPRFHSPRLPINKLIVTT